MLNYRECWSSVAGKGGQRIPVGCVMLATIDLQFGPFSFQFKWFFHIRPGTCKLNLSFAVRAKIIISFPQNSLEAQVLQTLLFFLPQCAKCSKVLGERCFKSGSLDLVVRRCFQRRHVGWPFHGQKGSDFRTKPLITIAHTREGCRSLLFIQHKGLLRLVVAGEKV